MLTKSKLTSLMLCISVMSWVSASYSTELNIGYNSKYISEGRNNIDEGGITWLQMSHELSDSLSWEGLYGAGNNYDELNLGLVYSQTLFEIDYYVSFTRLEFFKDKQHDTELAAGFSYPVLQPILLIVDSVYSFEAKGAFMELGLSSEMNISPNLMLAPYVKVGLDYSYASDHKTGYNHTVIGATITFNYSHNLYFNLFVEHSNLNSEIKRQTQQTNQNALGFHGVYAY